MFINGVDLKDETLTNTYDYIRNNPRHLYQRAQDIINGRLQNGQQTQPMQQPMPGNTPAGNTTSSWSLLENK